MSSDNVALVDAQNRLNAAVLRAPTAGIVASIGLTVGSTASTSQSITIVQPGAATVTVDVPLANIRAVAVGQNVSVTPDGSTTALPGTVASIGILPASTTSSTVSYPVVISVPHAGGALATGSRAQAGIVTGTVSSVLCVPNSAVTKTGTSTALANLLVNGKITRTIVQTGAVGEFQTQIVQGLSEGQQVVIADRSIALPTNSSTATSRFGGAGFGGAGGAGFGGAGGAGFGGAGFAGAGGAGGGAGGVQRSGG